MNAERYPGDFPGREFDHQRSGEAEPWPSVGNSGDRCGVCGFHACRCEGLEEPAQFVAECASIWNSHARGFAMLNYIGMPGILTTDLEGERWFSLPKRYDGAPVEDDHDYGRVPRYVAREVWSGPREGVWSGLPVSDGVAFAYTVTGRHWMAYHGRRVGAFAWLSDEGREVVRSAAFIAACTLLGWGVMVAFGWPEL